MGAGKEVRVADIRRRLEKITPGPWEVSRYARTHVRAKENDRGVCSAGGFNTTTHDATVENEANAEFIAASPTDVAYLLAELDAGEALLTWIRAIDNPYEDFEANGILCRFCFRDEHEPHESCPWQQAKAAPPVGAVPGAEKT